MAETKQESRRSAPLHVVVFPWLAFGHMIPFLELAQQLAKRGHSVTFLSAPRNLTRIRPVVPKELSRRLRFVPLHLPAVDGLPDGAESTADIPPEKTYLLKIAFDGLATPFAGFLAEACATGGEEEGHGKKPDWIVVDFAHHWLLPIANERKVPCALFLIVPAAFLAFMGSKELNEAHPRTSAEDFTVPPPWIPPPSPIAYRRHEAEWIVRFVLQPNGSGVADMARFWETADHCPLMVCRCSHELDGPLCPLLGDLFGKPVVPAGLLAPYDAAREAIETGGSGGGHDHKEDEDEEDGVVMRWLDAQPARSVLYVAFGSEAPLTPAHVREIALGLELAGARFLWALRQDTGGGARLLPDGFEARMAGRGVVRVGWVPQVRVIAHKAVGAFMTHAGLSSVVESLLFGHPLVMLPLFLDQGLTARLMAERRVGLEVPREDRDGSVSRDGVAAAVRRVMAAEDDEGAAFARNARTLQEVLWDTAKQERYVDELVAHLLQHRT